MTVDQDARLASELAPRYTVEGPIGRGGMATVYRARDTKNDRPVAVKVLRPELAAVLGPERFLNEIRVTANLNNPHILPLHDSGKADGQLYYVMPFVDGESLRERLRRERQLTIDEAMALAGQVCSALEHAHRHGVIHRDIKPENILLEDGEAVVADFGLALALHSAGTRLPDDSQEPVESESYRITSRGIAVGTPEYMSPEQATGEGFVDQRSDLYALGCVLYEMLTGDPPFAGSNAQAILARQVTEKPHPISTVRSEVPAALERLVMKSLAKLPADRFQNAHEFYDALAAVDVGDTENGSRWRPSVGWGVAAVGVAVGLTAIGWGIWPRPELNVDRIVAYPPEVLVAPGVEYEAPPGIGPAMATVLAAALDGFGGLHWVDGGDFLDRDGEAVLLGSGSELARRAREARAGYYTTGRVILDSSSARIVLALHHTGRNEVIEQVDTVGSWGAITGDLALHATGPLLLALLPADQSVPVTSVIGRGADAIQWFVQGERMFRRGDFDSAYEHFRAALAADSAFALAAYKASLSALWLDSLNLYSESTRLTALAVRHVDRLPPRDQHMVRGFDDFLGGRADQALAHYRRALALDPHYVPAHLGVGQVFRHLLPAEGPHDSLGALAFGAAQDTSDGRFAPVWGYLAQYAVRDGRLGEARRYAELMQTVPGIPASETVGVMLRCIEDGVEAVDWSELVQRDVNTAYQAARSMVVRASHPECAEAAFMAVVEHDTTTEYRFSSMVGLMSSYVATGEYEAFRAFVKLQQRTEPALGSFLEMFFVPATLAGAPFAWEADAWADRSQVGLTSLLGDSPGSSDVTLWFLGVWSAHRGDLDLAREVRDTLTSWAGRDHRRRHELIAKSLSIAVAVAEADTASAIDLLSTMRPTAPRPDLTWYPWEGLGLEWMTLARLELARGNYERAARVARYIEAPGSVPNIMYLAASRDIRSKAEERMR